MRVKRSPSLAARVADARKASGELNRDTDELNHRLAMAESQIIGLNLGVAASVGLEVDSSDRLELSLMKHNSQWGLFVTNGRADPAGSLERAVAGLTVRASKGPTLQGDPLFRLAERLRVLRRALADINPIADASIIAAVLDAAPLGKSELRERKRVEAAVPLIRARLEKKRPDIFPLNIEVDWEVEHGAARIAITPCTGAAARPVVVDWALVNSEQYDELYAVVQDIRSIGPAPYLFREDKEKTELQVEDAGALLEYLEARGARGMARTSVTPLLKASRETRVAAASRLAPLVEQLVQQIERQKAGVQRGIQAVDSLLGELDGSSS
jgi:hypothetical protein